MAVPSDPWQGRKRLYRRLKLFCVGLVGVSCALMAMYADASLPELAAVSVGGLAVGAVLVVLALPSTDAITPDRTRRGNE